MVTIAFYQVTPGEPERSAVVSRVCPSNCCEILCHCCAVSPFPWAVSWLQFQRLWFHVWSDCYWAIALFGEFSSLIRILKGSSLVAGFLFLPMPYAWFPHTEEPLKSVEAQLTEVHCSAGRCWRSKNAAPGFHLVWDLTGKNTVVSSKEHVRCVWSSI